MEDDAAKRKQQIEVLRDISRREYLKKREEDKLIELQQDIEDEKYLFGGEELTKDEREELKTKEELLKLANEYKKVQSRDDEGSLFLKLNKNLQVRSLSFLV